MQITINHNVPKSQLDKLRAEIATFIETARTAGMPPDAEVNSFTLTVSWCAAPVEVTEVPGDIWGM